MERRWRLSKLTVDREIFMNQRDIVKKILYAAKSEFYANRIKDQAGNPKALFRTDRGFSVANKTSTSIAYCKTWDNC